MARSLNKVQLIGNVGRDPEFKTFGSEGARVANFSMATSESRRNKDTGEFIDRTEWHRVVTFEEPLIRVIEQYVRKGSKLYIEGRLQTRSWEDNQGQRRYMTEVVLPRFGAELILLDAARGGHDGGRDFSARDDASARSGGDSNADQLRALNAIRDVGAHSGRNPTPLTDPDRSRSRGDDVAAGSGVGASEALVHDWQRRQGVVVAARSSGSSDEAGSRPSGTGGTPRKKAAFPASSGQSAEPDYGDELDDSIPF